MDKLRSIGKQVNSPGESGLSQLFSGVTVCVCIGTTSHYSNQFCTSTDVQSCTGLDCTTHTLALLKLLHKRAIYSLDRKHTQLLQISILRALIGNHDSYSTVQLTILCYYRLKSNNDVVAVVTFLNHNFVNWLIGCCWSIYIQVWHRMPFKHQPPRVLAWGFPHA